MVESRWAVRLLRIILISNGVITLCALPAVFMPTPTMDFYHRSMGLGSLPRGPIVEYLTRSLSAFYAAFGVFTLVIAADLRRFAPLVACWGYTMLGFGAVLLWVDLHAKMPALWTWGEFAYLAIVGTAVSWLQRNLLARH